MSSFFTNTARFFWRKVLKNIPFGYYLLDAFGIFASYALTIIILQQYVRPGTEFSYMYIILFSLIFISWAILSKVSSVAVLPRTQRYRTMFVRFLRICFAEMIITSILWIVLFRQVVPYMIVPVYCILSFMITFMVRIIGYSIFKHYRAKGYNSHFVIVVADAFSDEIIESLMEQNDWGFKVKYILSNSKLIRAKFGNKIKIFRENVDLRYLIDYDVIDEVIYCKNKISKKQLKYYKKTCDEVGVIFRFQSGLSPLEPFKVQLKTVGMSPYFPLVDVPSNHISVFLKSLSDIYISSMALILLSPILILIGIIIKLDSKGPVFFIQERVGLHGRIFKLFKFRTMVTDAERLLDKLREQNEVDGPVFKIKKDPRITKIGQFLRKTGLDELPQLINVIRGEMSLIGPRPPVYSEVVQYKRWQLRRLSVKPGITCSWQAEQNRHDVSFEKWMEMDLEYIDNWSLFEDIKLFFRTFRTVLLATGQ